MQAVNVHMESFSCNVITIRQCGKLREDGGGMAHLVIASCNTVSFLRLLTPSYAEVLYQSVQVNTTIVVLSCCGSD